MTLDTPVNTASTPASNPIVDHIRALLALPGSQVNLEQRGDHYRLRYREMRVGGVMSRRKGLELPKDMVIVAAIRELIEERRRRRRSSTAPAGKTRAVEVPPELDTVLQRILAACPGGRVLRRRIRLVFRIAAGLGHDTLMDFIKRRPWLAKPMPAGRPRRNDGTNSSF